MSGTTSGSMFADPTTMGLLGMSQGFAQAAMPSRMPVPFGAALGMGAAGMSQGAMAANQFALQQAQAKQAQLQTQQMEAIQPYLIEQNKAMAQGLTGGMTGDPNDPNAPLINPRMAAMLAIRAGLDPKNARGAQPWLDIIKSMAPQGGGYYIGQDGQVHTTGNADTAAAGRSGATAGAAAGAEAPYKKPFEVVEPDPSNPDHYITRTISPAQAPTYFGTSGQGGGSRFNPSNLGPAALSSIPDPGMRTAAINSAMRAGMPMSAIPYWISAIHNESGWNPNTPDGKSGEIGMGQVMPDTGQEMGYSVQQLRNPQTNLDASARYFTKQWQAANGDPIGALRGYNGGNHENRNAQGYADQALGRVYGWGGGRPVAAPQAPAVPAAVPSPAASNGPAPGFDANGHPVPFPTGTQVASNGPVPVPAQSQQGAAAQAQPAQPPIGVAGPPKLTEQQQEKLRVQEEGSKQDLAAENERIKGIYTDNMKAAQESAETLRQMDIAKQAIAAADAGGLGPNKLAPDALHAIAVAKALHIDLKPLGIDTNNLGAAQVGNEILTRLNAEILRRLYPQRITNVDIATTGQALPNYGLDPLSIDKNFQIFGAQANYDINRARDMLQYKQQHGNLRGWDTQWYLKNNNNFAAAPMQGLFDDLNKAKPQTAAQKPEKQAQQNPPVPGARQASDGNWYVSDPARPGKYLQVK